MELKKKFENGREVFAVITVDNRNVVHLNLVGADIVFSVDGRQPLLSSVVVVNSICPQQKSITNISKFRNPF